MTDREHLKIIKSIGFEMPTDYDYWVHDGIQFGFDIAYIGTLGALCLCVPDLGELIVTSALVTGAFASITMIHACKNPRRISRWAIAERKDSLEKGYQSRFLTREEQIGNFIKWAQSSKKNMQLFNESLKEFNLVIHEI